MKSEKATTTSILVVLLIYVFMAGNTSGEFVLCIGSNWHIAIEPLFHEHYYNRLHIERNESSTSGNKYYGHWNVPHCKSCIDIPIFVGPNSNRISLKPVKPNSETLVSFFDTAAVSDNQSLQPTAPSRSLFSSDENRFLRSIILLV